MEGIQLIFREVITIHQDKTIRTKTSKHKEQYNLSRSWLAKRVKNSLLLWGMERDNQSKVSMIGT